MGCLPATTIPTSLCVSVSLWEGGFALSTLWCNLQELRSTSQRCREKCLYPWVPDYQRLFSVLPAWLTGQIFHNNYLSLPLVTQFSCLSLLAFSEEFSKSLHCLRQLFPHHTSKENTMVHLPLAFLPSPSLPGPQWPISLPSLPPSFCLTSSSLAMGWETR